MRFLKLGVSRTTLCKDVEGVVGGPLTDAMLVAHIPGGKQEKCVHLRKKYFSILGAAKVCSGTS